MLHCYTSVYDNNNNECYIRKLVVCDNTVLIYIVTYDNTLLMQSDDLPKLTQNVSQFPNVSQFDPSDIIACNCEPLNPGTIRYDIYELISVRLL